MRYILPFLLPLCLIACTKSDKEKTSSHVSAAAIEADKAISVNMTYDREIDFTVKDIAVVPNNVAPWTGSLFIIDKTNTLRRGAIDRGDFDEIAKNISGIAPLARKNTAGVMIAHNPSGDIKAFYEINDENDYRPMPLSQPAEAIDGFCGMDQPNTNRVYAKSGQDIIALELISPQENSYIGAAKVSELSASGPQCNLVTSSQDLISLKAPDAALDSAILGDNSILFTTQESQSAPRLYLQRNNQVTAIDITGGISTRPPKQIDAIYVIPNSLGAVLRNGAVIMADNESQRLIYISLDFLMRRLNEAETTP